MGQDTIFLWNSPYHVHNENQRNMQKKHIIKDTSFYGSEMMKIYARERTSAAYSHGRFKAIQFTW